MSGINMSQKCLFCLVYHGFYFDQSSSRPNSLMGGLRIMILGLIKPSLSNIVYLVIFPNLGGNYYCTRVWGEHLEVICHLLHVHAWVYVPLREIPTL